MMLQPGTLARHFGWNIGRNDVAVSSSPNLNALDASVKGKPFFARTEPNEQAAACSTLYRQVDCNAQLGLQDALDENFRRTATLEALVEQSNIVVHAIDNAVQHIHQLHPVEGSPCDGNESSETQKALEDSLVGACKELDKLASSTHSRMRCQLLRTRSTGTAIRRQYQASIGLAILLGLLGSALMAVRIAALLHPKSHELATACEALAAVATLVTGLLGLAAYFVGVYQRQHRTTQTAVSCLKNLLERICSTRSAMEHCRSGFKTAFEDFRASLLSMEEQDLACIDGFNQLKSGLVVRLGGEEINGLMKHYAIHQMAQDAEGDHRLEALTLTLPDIPMFPLGIEY